MTLAAEPARAAPSLRLRFLRGRSAPTYIACFTILAFVVCALTIDLWSPYNPIGPAGPRLRPPSLSHWLGTDSLGRDVLIRTLYGTRYSLPLAAFVLAISVTVGVLLGAIAGFVGGWIDGLIMRLADVTLSFPPILLAMAIAASLGPGLVNTAIALMIVWWPIYARLMRAQVLNVKALEHVEAAVACGASSPRILFKHVMPLCWAPILVNASIDVGQVVLLAAGLSFVGLGAKPPTPEWGQMISEGAQAFYQWWIALGPGLAILLVSLSFNFLGDAMNDAADPRSGGRR